MSQGRRGNKRQAILRAALGLFAARGFDAVSVREVASAARITMPTLYHHFGDKRSLYLAACVHLFDRWGRQYGALLERPGSPQQRLIDYFTGLVASLQRDRQFASLLQREILAQDLAGIRTLSQRVFSGHFRQVTLLCGLLAAADPVLTAHTLYALAFGIGQLQPIGRSLGATRRIATPAGMARHVLSVGLPTIDWSRWRARPKL
jgi:AcrR family transcriptional regulator